MESTPLNSEQTSYSQALRQSGTALLALVNDVLDLSRIEAGKLTLTHEWTSPARLIEDVVELLAPDAQSKGLSVASWVGRDVPDKLLIDPVRVRQILVNLVGNAIKFTPEGAVNLSLDCTQAPVEGELAMFFLSVRDTGPGIAQEMQARLFEEFEQADTTRTRQHEGTGLGLAISRRLARMMNGDITFSSTEGKGSTFTLELSAAWLDGDESEISGQATNHDPMAVLSGNLLAGIDLTQADRRALFAYCRDWGMAFHAFSLEEWNETGRNINPDHLLINGADPDKAAHILKGFDPLRGGSLTRPLPRSRVILLDPAERRVIPQMRDSGVNAYLVKPIRQASLHLALLGHPSERPAQAATSEAVEGHAPDTRAHEPVSHQASIQILLVEDNEINALLARTILQKAGMTVAVAASGEEALRLYGEAFSEGETANRFDLAILDLHMPDMDGFALYDAMMAIEKTHGSAVPKIAFTADALSETQDKCLAHGFDTFLVKPVDPSILVQQVRNLVKAE